MKRKDLEALIQFANPNQPVKDFTKKELPFVLAHSIRHLRYQVDHPEMFVKHVRFEDELTPKGNQ